MSNDAKLQATNPSSADPTVVSLWPSLEELCSGGSVSQVHSDLRAAEDYMSYAEQQMWANDSTTTVTYGKGLVDSIGFPTPIVPGDLKEAGQPALEWIQTAPVSRRFGYSIVGIQGMTEIMDPVTGMYMAPNQHRTAAMATMAEAQDRDLSKMLQYKSRTPSTLLVGKGVLPLAQETAQFFTSSIQILS